LCAVTHRPLALLAPALLVFACSDITEPPPETTSASAAPTAAEIAAAKAAPPGGRPDLVAMLREDRDAPRHASDGGGRAWLAGEAEATAQTPGRWTVVYEAGPEGVADGGVVTFMSSPFWGWSTPQTEAPDYHGYTEVTTDADGVELETATLDAQLLGITVRGRRLEPGERIRIVFGAGEIGAGADRFAEREERFWIGVDGDGDGIRAMLPSSPPIDVGPGPPERLQLLLTSSARPGGTVRLTVAVLDPSGSTGVPFVGRLALEVPDALEGPRSLELGAEDAGRTEASYVARAPGVHRISARVGELAAESNPLEVAADASPVLWADLHGHSNLSDGTGTPEDYYTYAREAAGLDVASLTDHDHWGVRFLDEEPALWERIRAAAADAHEPGRFVTLLGYEWTSWIHGHRHVLYFGDEGRVYSSLDEATDDPDELWAALRGQPALTFAHHSAGGPIPTNWLFAPDPVLEPVTEVVSVHGSSEALDSPHVIYSPVPGNFVRDVLDGGVRFGFVGSGDSHDGHPGLAHIASPVGGVAAILADSSTREAVLAALRERRVYATSGPRILLRASLAGRPMGAAVPADAVADGGLLRVRVVSPGEIQQLEVIRSGAVAHTRSGEGRRELDLELELDDLAAGEYVYVRAILYGSATAWSSPFFVE
jgi:hypothetical protein